MNRRRFLWIIPGVLIPAVVKAEGEVSIPEGECVTACWDEQMQEVPCPPEEDVCPGYEPPYYGDIEDWNGPYTSHETGDVYVICDGVRHWVGNDPRGRHWLFDLTCPDPVGVTSGDPVVVVQLPSTGTGETR